MKVDASLIEMTSDASYFGRQVEKNFKIEDDGILVSRKTTEEKRHTEAYRLYVTGGDESLELESPLASMDSRQRTLYTASIFDWAANAIEEVVGKFQGEAESSRGLRNGSSNTARTPLSIDDSRVQIYTEMASEFRKQVNTLIPEGSELEEVWQENRMNAKIIEARYSNFYEKETTLVTANGIVKTAGGHEINFSLNLGMQREARVEKFEIIKMVDPLVINFSGEVANLTGGRMQFDLDGDGTAEEVARLGKGSGFLTLDLNGDGRVNSGKELFGPSTGNGFKELAFYDKDNNNWIDENDPIYDQLMVWTGEGKGGLKKLSHTGIGAIHLGAVTSPFMIKDAANNALGQVVSTGLALTEDGRVTSVQQVDLTV